MVSPSDSGRVHPTPPQLRRRGLGSSGFTRRNHMDTPGENKQERTNRREQTKSSRKMGKKREKW